MCAGSFLKSKIEKRFYCLAFKELFACANFLSRKFLISCQAGCLLLFSSLSPPRESGVFIRISSYLVKHSLGQLCKVLFFNENLTPYLVKSFLTKTLRTFHLYQVNQIGSYINNIQEEYVSVRCSCDKECEFLRIPALTCDQR